MLSMRDSCHFLVLAWTHFVRAQPALMLAVSSVAISLVTGFGQVGTGTGPHLPERAVFEGADSFARHDLPVLPDYRVVADAVDRLQAWVRKQAAVQAQRWALGSGWLRRALATLVGVVGVVASAVAGWLIARSLQERAQGCTHAIQSRERSARPLTTAQRRAKRAAQLLAARASLQAVIAYSRHRLGPAGSSSAAAMALRFRAERLKLLEKLRTSRCWLG